MTEDEIRNALLLAIESVAPEADAASLDPAEPLRDQLDIDSMDFLNLLTAVRDRTGVEVPEADGAKLATLDGAVAYLAARLRATA
jgi:acyl carrier protein